MNRKHIIILAPLALLAVIISYRVWILPESPSQTVDGWMLVAAASFYMGIVGYVLWNGRLMDRSRVARAVLPIVLFSLAFLASLYAAMPVSKTHAEAAEFTKQKQVTVSAAIQLGKRVQSGQLKDDVAQLELDKLTADAETIPVATHAYNLAAQTDMTDLEVQQEVAPTVPVRLGNWTCNQIGCSFADAERIWTVTYRQKAISTAFAFAALSLILLGAGAVGIRNSRKN